MKRLFLCSFFLVLIFTQGYGQINWTKYENNPVLTRGTNGTWDDVAIHGPNIMFDGSLYHMWYAGYEGQHNRIGYASSSDGIAWTKHSSYILDRGNSGTWDDAVVFQPWMLSFLTELITCSTKEAMVPIHKLAMPHQRMVSAGKRIR